MMDENADINFIDENNYSIISNEDIPKITESEYVSHSSITGAKNTLKKKDIDNRNNQMAQIANFQGANDWDWMNGERNYKENFESYLIQLKQYMLQNCPEMIRVFQNRHSGDFDEDRGRMTPLQFSESHIICKLGFAGLILQHLPNTLNQEHGIITISGDIFLKLDDFQIDDYPGPLTLEQTTEGQIDSYLKDQMSMELQDTSPIDWDSGHLLINYLELMIKENGKPRVSSIVRLLNEGVETKTADMRKDSKTFDTISRNSYSRASSRATSRASSRPSSPNNLDSIDLDLPQNSLDTPHGPGSVTSAVRRAVVNVSNHQKECQNMDRYRQYIMTGRFEEAVHFATKAGIWDHAFALALRMNNVQLINEVLVSFSRRAIYSNDPLFTMHEIMAQKQPKIVAANRGFSNNEMSDWRCHLGMILAIKKFRPEECRQAIESLGEKLSALRSYYAAHLCYLLAGTPFGLDKSSIRYRRKYDLIGWQSSTSSIPAQKSSYSTCHKLFTDLHYWRSAPEQSIKLTEVYEYALKLCHDNQHVSLSIHLLPYKYLMVYKMLSKNQVSNAYEYCMNIGDILGYEVDWLECESINMKIISNIRYLSYRLHSLFTSFNRDLNYCQKSDTWLANIEAVYCRFCGKYGVWNPNTPKPDFSVSRITEEENLFNQSHSDNMTSASYELNGYLYGESTTANETAYANDDSSHRSQSDQINSRNTNQQYHNTNDAYSAQMNFNDYRHQNEPLQPIAESNPSFHTKSFVSQPKPSRQPNLATYGGDHINKQYDNRQMQQINAPVASSMVSPMQQNIASQNRTSHQQQQHQHNQQQHHQQQQQHQHQHQHQHQLQQHQQPSFTKSKHESTVFRDIAPPSELPNEAIMTEPPKFGDIKSTTSYNNDRDRINTNHMYDAMSHKMRSLPGDKGPPPMNRQLNPIGGGVGSNENQKILPNNRSLSPPYSLDNYSTGNKPGTMNQSGQASPSYPIYQPSSYPMATDDPAATAGVSSGQPGFSKTKHFTFVPPVNNVEDDNMVDCFTNYASRSRSQSNGSLGSVENMGKPLTGGSLSRSRNSSESKDSISTVPYQTSPAVRTLQSTKEEPDNSSSVETEKSKSELAKQAKASGGGWGFLNRLIPSKTKEIHLPNDNEKTMVFDEKKNKWIDKSNPESEKPLTPPPILPAFSTGAILTPPMDPFLAGSSTNQFVKSRYRQVALNVKPSSAVGLPPPNPTDLLSIIGNQNQNNRPNQQETTRGSYEQSHNYNAAMDYGSYGTDNSVQYNYSDQYHPSQTATNSLKHY